MGRSWCGVLQSEAELLCYYAGQGYGNSWNICRGQTFAYTSGDLVLEYDYAVETEELFDFVYVLVDTVAGDYDNVPVTSYDGVAAGSASHLLTPGTTLPSAPGDILIKFCFASDGAYSDEDGITPTTCGGFALDRIDVSGTGISDFADFELGEGSWELVSRYPPGPSGGSSAGSRCSGIRTLVPKPANCAFRIGWIGDPHSTTGPHRCAPRVSRSTRSRQHTQ